MQRILNYQLPWRVLVFLVVIAGLSLTFTPMSQRVQAQTTYPVSSTGPLPTEDGVYMWSNGGPTAAFSNENLKTTSVCNGNFCWEWNQVQRRWMRNRQSIRLSSSLSFLKPEGGVYPWSNAGLSSGWENYDLGTLSLNNGVFAWMWFSKNNPPAGEWINDLKPRKLSTSEPWNTVKAGPGGLKPWSGAGITSAWTNKKTNREYYCQGKYCWVLKSTDRAWENNGNPIDISTIFQVKAASDGSMPWSRNPFVNLDGPTLGWTNETDNKVVICNGPWCWSFTMATGDSWNLSNVAWSNSGSPSNLCSTWTQAGTQCPGLSTSTPTPSPTPTPTPTPFPTPAPPSTLSVACLAERSNGARMQGVFRWQGVSGVDRYILRIHSPKTCTDQAGQTIEWLCPDTQTPENGDRFINVSPQANCDPTSHQCTLTLPMADAMTYQGWSMQGVQRVNGTEVLSAQINYGTTGSLTPFGCDSADLNGDGSVNQADYTQLVSHFGTNTCASNLVGVCPSQPAAITIQDFNLMVTRVRR